MDDNKFISHEISKWIIRENLYLINKQWPDKTKYLVYYDVDNFVIWFLTFDNFEKDINQIILNQEGFLNKKISKDLLELDSKNWGSLEKDVKSIYFWLNKEIIKFWNKEIYINKESDFFEHLNKELLKYEKSILELFIIMDYRINNKTFSNDSWELYKTNHKLSKGKFEFLISRIKQTLPRMPLHSEFNLFKGKDYWFLQIGEWAFEITHKKYFYDLRAIKEDNRIKIKISNSKEKNTSKNKNKFRIVESYFLNNFLKDNDQFVNWMFEYRGTPQLDRYAYININQTYDLLNLRNRTESTFFIHTFEEDDVEAIIKKYVDNNIEAKQINIREFYDLKRRKIIN